MDSVLVKILMSRKKSVAKLEAELVDLAAKRANATPSVAAVLQSVINVQTQRLSRLKAEVAALEAEGPTAKDDRQGELAVSSSSTIPPVTPTTRIPGTKDNDPVMKEMARNAPEVVEGRSAEPAHPPRTVEPRKR